MSDKINVEIFKDGDLNSAFEENDEYNSYYETVSVIFRVISFALFACLLLFVITSAFVGAEVFSYSNLEYITRNFALTLKENKDSTRQPIRYNPDPMNQFCLFGKGLAVCGSSSVSIYSATGRQTCHEAINFRNPVMATSDKYVLIYDEGSGDYVVYNSFSSVHKETLSHPIRGAVLADNGYYALLSSSNDYNSTVEVYSPNFSLITRYNKNGYISCMDINESEILIVTANTELGASDFNVEILVSSVGDSKASFSTDLKTGFPLGCKITPYGFVVVCTDSVQILDKSGNLIGNYSFDDTTLSGFAISSTNVLMLFKNKSFETEYELVCLEVDGSIFYQFSLSETVFDIELYESKAFALTETSISCFEPESNQDIDVNKSDYGHRLLATGRDEYYYCSDVCASYYVGALD